MLSDVGQWMHHIKDTSRTSEVVFVLLRITMFRSVLLYARACMPE